VKLARAFWIVPISLGTALVFKQKGVKLTMPNFILGFVVTMLFNFYLPAAAALGPLVVGLAKLWLTVTLFLNWRGSVGQRYALGRREALLAGPVAVSGGFGGLAAG
jgi:uncharacterized membrane protein YadS